MAIEASPESLISAPKFRSPPNFLPWAVVLISLISFLISLRKTLYMANRKKLLAEKTLKPKSPNSKPKSRLCLSQIKWIENNPTPDLSKFPRSGRIELTGLKNRSSSRQTRAVAISQRAALENHFVAPQIRKIKPKWRSRRKNHKQIDGQDLWVAGEGAIGKRKLRLVCLLEEDRGGGERFKGQTSSRNKIETSNRCTRSDFLFLTNKLHDELALNMVFNYNLNLLVVGKRFFLNAFSFETTTLWLEKKLSIEPSFAEQLSNEQIFIDQHPVEDDPTPTMVEKAGYSGDEQDKNNAMSPKITKAMKASP